ncbi:DNA replication licensing factor MCM4-like [Cryptomeria japonica]|uniref:DNA replication licensing factor MCM4-like n=1 Tax=Cryptomeria japonica TaxID=3369 RepID=UPI0027D9EB04|nr:DNA replication licensing factor MCM4-like [Cryptomeria japonica]
MVLACFNPRSSHYNPRLLAIDNIQLPPTLLFRFDLIDLVLDKADEQTYHRLARHLVAFHYDECEDQTLDALDLPTLTSYITYARQHIHPKISDEVAEDLIRGYVEMCRKGNFPGMVERCDVAEAFRLLEVALQQSPIDHSTGTIDMDLITMGVSTNERIRRANLVSSVRIIIIEKMQEGGPSTRIT